ncbi:hypothetical protein M758_5G128700 [Ceratodon purpureus]|nr:hypothetical protein M758_5G128700 [Ceratodon purpureus]
MRNLCAQNSTEASPPLSVNSNSNQKQFSQQNAPPYTSQKYIKNGSPLLSSPLHYSPLLSWEANPKTMQHQGLSDLVGAGPKVAVLVAGPIDPDPEQQHTLNSETRKQELMGRWLTYPV